jgi:hypothetical protein
LKPDKQFENEEEKKTKEKVNIVTKELKEGTFIDHYGKDYWVQEPTGR